MRRSLFAFVLIATVSLMPASFSRAQDPAPFAAAGEAKMQQGRYLDAIDAYGKAIKADKRNPVYYQNRAKAELAVQRWKSAVTDTSKAIKFAPDDLTNYELRAKAFEALKQYEKSREDLNKLIAAQPNNGSFLLQRAQVCIQLHKADDVLKDCNQAIQTGLDRAQLASLYKMRSIAYKNLGKKSEAAQEAGKYDSLK